MPPNRSERGGNDFEPDAPNGAAVAGNGDWRSRVISGRELGGTQLPQWAERSYQALHTEVIDDAYPCFFGTQAEKRGEMFYAFVTHDDAVSLIESVATFTQLAGLPAYDKNNLAVFFEPDPEPLTHHEYHDRFWRALQSLHHADTHPHADRPIDPADPAWEFCYGGVEMFVVCGCPSFHRRHSRNLGPGMVLLFQPRSVFLDKITNKVIGRRARQEVRKRLKTWDDVTAHPDLGFYGDPDNLEWKQYFLPDDNHPHTGSCPFLSRHSQVASQVAATSAQSELLLNVDRNGHPAPEDRNFPLTPTQAALWFLWRMDAASAAWNISLAIELEGLLDGKAIYSALLAVVERHSILRTGFVDMGGIAWQCIDADAGRAVDWEEHDLRHHVAPLNCVREVLRDRGNRSFDLGGDGLVRATLLQLAGNRGILQLCTHQIVSDAWSLDILRRELLEYCAAAFEERSPDLPALPRQFCEYAMQVCNVTDTRALARQLGYWRDRLGSAAYVLELPLDHPRPARRSSACGRLSYVLSPELHAGVRRLSAMHDTTPFVVTLCVFALLMQRYCLHSDVRIAVRLSSMESSERESMVGQFTNTAVIRLLVVSTGVFAGLIEQAKRVLAEAHANGDLPFASLVESLRVHRSLADTPLCQVMFNRLPTFAPARHGSLQVRSFDDEVGRAQYDLSMHVAIDDDGGTLFLDYATTLFDASTAQQLLTHYRRLLEQLTASAVATNTVLAAVRLTRLENDAAVAA